MSEEKRTPPEISGEINRIEAKTKTAEFTIAVPKPFVPPDTSVKRIMSLADIAPDKYRVRSDISNWSNPGSDSRRDDDGKLQLGEKPTVRYAKQNEEGVWEISANGAGDLLKNARYRLSYNSEAFGNSVIEEIRGEDVASEIRNQLAQENSDAKKAWLAEVSEFAKILKQGREFDVMSASTKGKIEKWALAKFWPDIPKIDEEEVRNEWLKANELLRREKEGEILLNFGGIFRSAGNSDLRDYWVITPDGKLREPDKIEYRGRSQTDGEKRWRVVEEEETAVEWRKDSTAAKHEFSYEKNPVDGETEEQEQAVKQLIKDITDRFKR